MGQFVGTAFGTPTYYGTQAFPQQPYFQTLTNPFIGASYGAGPYGIGQVPWSPVQQIAQLLQIVPQQLQQVQQLQQQQVQYLQQLLQWVPAQLQQLQQLVQLLPHQHQQFQQQGLPLGPIAGPLTFGLAPQTFAGQAASHVM